MNSKEYDKEQLIQEVRLFVQLEEVVIDSIGVVHVLMFHIGFQSDLVRKLS